MQPWNKGKKLSDDYKEKLSIAHIGIMDSATASQRGKIGAMNRWVNHTKKIKTIKKTHTVQNIKFTTQSEYNRLWRMANPGLSKMYKKNREARKRGSEGSHTLEEWELLKRIFAYSCACCKRQEPEIMLTEDHIIPLSRGGSNFIHNIQPLCISCNSRKSTNIISYMPPSTSLNYEEKGLVKK